MKVLLLSPPAIPGFARDARSDFESLSDSHWHPIWLAYCGALLKKYGHRVGLIDAPPYRLSQSDVLQRITEFSPDLLVIYSSTKTIHKDIGFSEAVKNKLNCFIIFVGPFVSLQANEILAVSHDVIDAAVKGEFEFPVLEIAEGADKKKIKNLVWREASQIIENERRLPLNREQLDEIPFVSSFYKRHLDLRHYRIPSEPYPFVSLHTGRGCWWGRCSFCLWYPAFIPSGSYNTRSINNVIEELEFIKTEMPEVRGVFFQDDTLPKQRALELSRAILDNNLRIKWSCLVRADLDFEALKLMREAGCYTLHVGYESADLAVLEGASKGINPEEMLRFTADAKKCGLRIHANFVIGLPGEDKITINKTVEFAKKLDPDLAQFCLLNIYPNTSLYRQLHANNYVADGRVNYPHLVYHDLCKCANEAYKDFYFRWSFIRRLFLRPKENLFGQLRPMSIMLPKLLWERLG